MKYQRYGKEEMLLGAMIDDVSILFYFFFTSNNNHFSIVQSVH